MQDTPAGSPFRPHDFAGDARWHHLFYGSPSASDVREFASWLRSHPNDFVRLYHGTAAINKVQAEGLKPTSLKRRNSYQSTPGYTYLSVYPGSAKSFGGYAALNRAATPEGRRIAVYPVIKTVRGLLADKDQLNNRRMEGIDLGDSLAESLVWGHGARVRGGIGLESIGAPVMFSALEAPARRESVVAPGDDVRRVEVGVVKFLGEAAGAALLGPSSGIQIIHSRDLGKIVGPLRRSPPGPESSPEFRAWFGRSAVVGEDGRALVVYHGTTRDFTEFDPATRGEKTGAADARAGYFFAENPRAAEQFTWEEGEKSGHIMPVYLRMESPFMSSMPLDGANGTQAGQVIERARAAGHDGVVFENSDMLGHRGRTYVVFDATQVKSATGNRGTFDPSSPDIRFGLQSAVAPVPVGGFAPLMSPAGVMQILDFGGEENFLAEQQRVVSQALESIGSHKDCVILRSRGADRWQMVLRDASEPGRWRSQGFDGRGFSGHVSYGTKEEALEGVVGQGYTERDDGALDRLQDTPAFQRGLYCGEMMRRVELGLLPRDEANQQIRQFDASRHVLDEVAWASAQALYSTSTDRITLIADRIAPGEEGAVLLHEIVHKHGRRALGAPAMARLVGRVGAWAGAPIGSLERRIHEAASRRALRAAPNNVALRAEEFLAYAVEEAVLMGVHPSLEAPEGTAEAWLADVAATIRGAVAELIKGAPPELSPQRLVDLAYALAQLEIPERASAIRAELGDEIVDWARARLSAVVAAPVEQTQTPGFLAWSRGLPVVEVENQDEFDFRTGQGVVVEALHGTTADFERFDTARLGLGCNVGAGIYTTNSVTDASANYAGFGPDLTARVESLKERIEQELDESGEEWSDLEVEARARERAGVMHDGAILPVFVRFENPVVLGGRDETRLSFVLDDESERASGTLWEFLEALRDQAREVEPLIYPADVESIADSLMDEALQNDGDIRVSEVLRAFNNADVMQDPESGEVVNSEVFRRALAAIGFDGIIDKSVFAKFVAGRPVPARMAGVAPDTIHFVAFSPDQVASRIGSTWCRDVDTDVLVKSEVDSASAPGYSRCRA